MISKEKGRGVCWRPQERSAVTRSRWEINVSPPITGDWQYCDRDKVPTSIKSHSIVICCVVVVALLLAGHRTRPLIFMHDAFSFTQATSQMTFQNILWKHRISNKKILQL